MLALPVPSIDSDADDAWLERAPGSRRSGMGGVAGIWLGARRGGGGGGIFFVGVAAPPPLA